MDLSNAPLYTEDDYYNTPEDVRCELIDGQLIYAQAAPSRIHQTILGELHFLIKEYIKSKNGSCKVYPAPFAVKLRNDKDNIVEPDISVICDPNKLTDRGCAGAPDWIIEIVSPSNSSHDYVKKLNLYLDAGVREYWIVDPTTDIILVYILNDESFNLQTYTFNDTVKVGIYDDLKIDFSSFEL